MHRVMLSHRHWAFDGHQAHHMAPGMLPEVRYGR